MDGPARRENGDDAIFLEIDLSENTIRALVDTGASDCFISKATRNQLPAEQIIDTWKVDEGQIQLANNSNIHILEQLRIKFKLAGTTVCYDFNVGGLPLITYASRGGGGVNTNAYKCVQGGRGGLNMTKNTHFVRRFIENPTYLLREWVTQISVGIWMLS